MPVLRLAVPQGLRERGLTLQLFFLVILPITILLLAIPFGSLTLHGRAMRQLVAERDERAVRAAATTLSEGLRHRASAVQSMALNAAGAASLEGHRFLLADFEGGIALFDSDGSLRVASNAADGWSGRPVADLLGKQGPVFSEAFEDPASGGRLILAAVAGPTGETAVGAFSLTGLATKAFPPDPSAPDLPLVFIVNPAGEVLFSSGTALGQGEIARHAGVAEALRGEAGSTFLAVDGSEHVIAYAPVPPVGWALVIEEPWETVDNPLLRRTQTAPLVLVPVVLFALIVLAFGIRQIVQPLRRLERKASELAWGRFEAIEDSVGGISEIRRLQAELVHMAHKIRAAQQNLRDYVGAVTTGQEDERRRLARELHDGTIQSLVALNQRLQLARARADDQSWAGALTEAQRMTAQTIEDLRRFIRNLRPIYLEDLGLVPALDMLARDVQDQCAIPIDFDSSGQERRLSPEVELTLYRIAQEALSNVARHSRATRARVTIAFEPAGVRLSVWDDGRGFAVPESPAEFVPRGHFGLLGLHERSELIGARLSIHSSPGSGANVEVSLPETGNTGKEKRKQKEASVGRDLV